MPTEQQQAGAAKVWTHECTSSDQLGQIERGNKRVLSSSGLSSGHCLVMEPSSQFDSFALDGLPPCENG
jgi:hypothetical protein